MSDHLEEQHHEDEHPGEEVDVGNSYVAEDIKPDLLMESYMMETTAHSRRSSAGNRYLCPYGCNKLVAMRTIDYHKNNGCGRPFPELTNTNPDAKRRFYCCGVCYAEFMQRAEFHAHLRHEHDVHPETHSLQFRDRNHFNRFLHWLEMEGGAHFRHKSGAKRRARGKGIFMACNRSGFVNNGNYTGDPQKDRVGPFRIGYSCTAFIHGTEHEDGRITVEMCGDHYGHDARMRLPNIVKYIIASKQMEGEPNQAIIEYLKTHFSPFAYDNIFAQRICLVDQEELRTINLTCTRKWEQSGIPSTCEVWEEELLDRAGIEREGAPRLRAIEDKTTQELAVEENWPRPRVFVAKSRSEQTGEFVPLDDGHRRSMHMGLGPHAVPPGQTRNSEDTGEAGPQVVQDLECDDFEHDYDDNLVDMDEFGEEGEHSEATITSELAKGNGERKRNFRPGSSKKRSATAAGINGEELNEDIRVKDYLVSQGMPGPVRASVPFLSLNSSSKMQIIDEILNEAEIIKEAVQVENRHLSIANMRCFLVRLQALRCQITQEFADTTTIYPHDEAAGPRYKPGKVVIQGVEVPYSKSRRHQPMDVRIEAVEDQYSDDENVLASSGLTQTVMSSSIWG